MSGISDRIRDEVAGWPGAEERPHRFRGIEFQVRGHEIGHLHGERLVDLPFPVRVREGLVARGKARPHHILPQTGWVSYPLHGEDDVPGALESFRISYDRLVACREGSE